MAELTVPSLDFTALGQLPQVYKQAQADEMRKQTLASLGQGGNIDATTLLKSGDMSLAQLGMTMQQRQAEDAWRRQESQRTQQNADRNYQLAARSAARADDPTPAGFMKTADGSYAPLPGGPTDPAYIAKKDSATGQGSLQAVVDQRRAVAESLGLTKGTPSYNSYVMTGKTGRDETLLAGDRKVINEAEDELPNIQGTLESLQLAKSLNGKTYSGYTAGTRAAIGSNLPDAMVPDFLASKGGSDATTEWQKLMGPEALKTMANTLKGATTDFELKKFTEMLADPTTPPKIREGIINRMITLSERKKDLAERRINDLRGGTYYKPKAPAGSATGAPQPSQGNGADTMLGHAREALAAGAPREAVLQRLQAAGIDPSGL